MTVTKALGRLPVYLTLEYGLPLIEAILTDPVITTLALGAIALGFATNLVWAAAAFCFVYVFLRAINSIANAIGNTGIALTKETNHLMMMAKHIANIQQAKNAPFALPREDKIFPHT